MRVPFLIKSSSASARLLHSYFTFISLIVLITTATAQPATRKRVVMISIDGTPDYLVDRFLKNGVLPPNGAFARMKKSGAYAETLLPVNVASTGPSHIAIFTGAEPGSSGIVGNSFRQVNQSWEEPSLTAFKQPFTAETIFSAARRQGKKVITLGGVGLDYSDSSRMTDEMFMYPVIAGTSAVYDLKKSDRKTIAGEEYIRLVTDKQSALPEIRLYNEAITRCWFYLKDSSKNEANVLKPAYQIIVDNDSTLENGYLAAVKETGWETFRLIHNRKTYAVSANLFSASRADGWFRMYFSPPAELFGLPDAFMQRLQSACGIWPGEPDNLKQTAGVVPEEKWMEQTGRLATYSKKLILAGMQEDNWDLLFGYFSTLDDIQHRYTVSDKRQLDYTAENGNRPARYEKIIGEWFSTIDRYLLEIMNAAPPGTSIIVFSDHGMIPMHSTLLINNYLDKAGFSNTGKEVQAITSGNSAHVYINRNLIDSTRYPDYLRRLRQSLADLKDEKTGKPIFLLIADSTEQKKHGLYHAEYSGDLFISCREGFSISSRFVPGAPFLIQNTFDMNLVRDQPEAVRNFLLKGTMNETGRAVHGCLSTVRKGQSVFYAWGNHVPAKKIKKMRSLQITPTVAKLLDIQAPVMATDKPAF